MDQATFMAATGIRQPNADAWFAAVQAAMTRYDIETPSRQAAFLAQVAFESQLFRLPPVAESFNYSIAGLQATFKSLTAPQCAVLGRQPGERSVPLARQQQIANLVYGGKYGNGAASSGDGWMYRGSGLIQLTFRANYDTAGQAIGANLVGNPDSVRNDVNVAALVSAWFFQSHGCNALADTGDFDAISKIINGGDNGAQDRRAAYAVACKALSVTQGAGAVAA